MAEPVRKCARCRLRVQGVRPLDDGLSYCAKCIAQMEQVRPAEPVHEDIAPDLKLIPEEPYVTTSASSETPDAALEAVEAASTPDAALQAVEAASTPDAAPQAAEAASTPAAPPAEQAETAVESGSEPVPISDPDGGGALKSALATERDALQAQRAELAAERERLERDISVVDVRVAHVDALLETEIAS